MQLEEAIELLKRHNEWRRGAEIEMEHPKELGIAIDTLITFTEKVLGEPSDACVEVCVSEINRDVKNKVSRSNVRNGIKAMIAQLVNEVEQGHDEGNQLKKEGEK